MQSSLSPLSNVVSDVVFLQETIGKLTVKSMSYMFFELLVSSL